MVSHVLVSSHPVVLQGSAKAGKIVPGFPALGSIGVGIKFQNIKSKSPLRPSPHLPHNAPFMLSDTALRDIAGRKHLEGHGYTVSAFNDSRGVAGFDGQLANLDCRSRPRCPPGISNC